MNRTRVYWFAVFALIFVSANPSLARASGCHSLYSVWSHPLLSEAYGQQRVPNALLESLVERLGIIPDGFRERALEQILIDQDVLRPMPLEFILSFLSITGEGATARMHFFRSLTATGPRPEQRFMETMMGWGMDTIELYIEGLTRQEIQRAQDWIYKQYPMLRGVNLQVDGEAGTALATHLKEEIGAMPVVIFLEEGRRAPFARMLYD